MNIPAALWLVRNMTGLGISLLTVLSIFIFSGTAQANTRDTRVVTQETDSELLAQTQRTQVIRRSVVRQTSFTDISQDYWASSFIYPLSNRSVLEGFPNGMFMPTNGLTHSQFAALINKAFDVRTVRRVSSISGISRSYWAYSAIQKAYSMGFIDLDDIVANPERRLTRLDVLVSLARGLGYTEIVSGKSVTEILSIYEDAATIPREYRLLIAALTERGIIVNYPNRKRLNLFQVVSRSEACGFVHQAMASQGILEYVRNEYVADDFLDVFISINNNVEINNSVDVDNDVSGSSGDDDDDDD
jgi:hypothetical protein